MKEFITTLVVTCICFVVSVKLVTSISQDEIIEELQNIRVELNQITEIIKEV